jgi:hypothetical protein
VYTPGSGPIRIKAYGVEETLVDCFRHRRKLGMMAAGPGPAAAAGDGALSKPQKVTPAALHPAYKEAEGT